MSQINIVVQTQIAVGQTVARSHNSTPLNLPVGCAHLCRNVGCRLADQFEITKRGVVSQAVADEGVLVDCVGVF